MLVFLLSSASIKDRKSLNEIDVNGRSLQSINKYLTLAVLRPVRIREVLPFFLSLLLL